VCSLLYNSYIHEISFAKQVLIQLCVDGVEQPQALIHHDLFLVVDHVLIEMIQIPLNDK
jgi:hypothetical protein